MKYNNSLTQASLKEVLFYDSETGIFTWKKHTYKNRIGVVAGGVNSLGYINIVVNKKSLLVHRLAWLYIFGNFPKETIDHINMNKSDNRLCNLREASSSQNAMNRHHRLGPTGRRGVAQRGDKYAAYLMKNKEHIYIGTYDTIDEAGEAYDKKAVEVFGEFYPICTQKAETEGGS